MTRMCQLDHEHKHGVKTTCYHHGKCRCEPCRNYHDRRARQRRKDRAYGRYEGMVDSTGTRRRIQALNALGWADRVIGEQCGLYSQQVYAVKTTSKVTPKMRDRINTAYEALSGKAPKPCKSVNQVKFFARRYRFVPPLAWNDIDNDPEPEGVGEQKLLRAEELLDEIEWLIESGAAPTEIARAVNKPLPVLERHAWRYGRGHVATYLHERSVA